MLYLYLYLFSNNEDFFSDAGKINKKE